MTFSSSLPRTLLFLVASLWAGSALAQEASTPASPFVTEATRPTQPAPTPQPYVPPTPVAVPYAQPAPPQDGPRFRFGAGYGAGGEFADEFSAWLIGFDLRLGVQVNDMIGVYLQPHVSFGKRTSDTLSGGTATVALAAMVDLTLSDRFFVGGGFGYGIVHDPRGPMLALRAGFYPRDGRTAWGRRRKGASLSFDFRTHFTGMGPVVQVMGMVGYEVF